MLSFGNNGMSSNFNIILKISDSCPLACDYCYYFRNPVCKSKSRPNKISLEVIKQLCLRIMEYSKQHINKIDKVVFTLHGGEPLAVGKTFFRYIIETISRNLCIPYELILQSNGVLIDNEWIEIIKTYNIQLGISIDGPEEYQNIHRKLKNGEGSFSIVDKNIRLCIKNNINVGVLMVADPTFEPKKIWNYLVNDLGIDGMDILVRDYTHDTLPSMQYVKTLSNYLVEWLNIWMNHNDATIKIRIFDSIINLLLGKNSELEFGFKKSTNVVPTITMYTNGDISPSDELMSIGRDFMNIDKNILLNDLDNIFAVSIFKEIERAYCITPNDCVSCCWSNVCGGGCGILGRYSQKNAFSNKGIYCLIWKKLFSIVSARLLKSGYSKESLIKVLSGKSK